MKKTSRNLALIAGVIAVGAILYFFRDIVSYVIIAWVLSMIGRPLVRFFKQYMSPTLSAGVVLFIFSICFVLLFAIFVPTLVQQAKNLGGIDYQSVVQSLEEPIDDVTNFLVKRGLMEPKSELQESVSAAQETKQIVQTKVIDLEELGGVVHDSIHDNKVLLQVNVFPDREIAQDTIQHAAQPTGALGVLQNSISKVLDPSAITKLFGSVIGFLGNFMITIMSVLFITFFFLKDGDMFEDIISAIVPDEYEVKTLNALHGSSQMLVRYFVGILTQMTAITLFVWILLLILGVKNALLIGFFAALMNLIPYIGPLLGGGFAVLITISSNLELPFYGEMLPLLGKVIAVFGVMQLLDNFILQPNIFSRSVKAHPLEIFIIVMVGAKLGGVVGMVLAIPAYTVLRVVAKEFLSKFKIVQSLTKSM